MSFQQTDPVTGKWEQALKFRKLLPNVWFPFFSGFGQTRPVQIRTAPLILNGNNVVVTSPTASGKTEAVVAPIAELFKSSGWRDLSLLYVVPTRALANDTLARIEGPLSELSMSVSKKHGDSPSLPKDPPNVLITTPESLDSMLCRYPLLLNTVKAVVVDEVHMIDNTYRGDQMRLLLRRLCEIKAGEPFNIHLTSATIGDIRGMGERYAESFEIVSVGGSRTINGSVVKSVEEVVSFAKKLRSKKILCFCNKRETVEQAASTMGLLFKPYPVVTHHGSLSKSEREDAECVMKQHRVAVCVATSTLEVGIDIGDIDLVALLEPPWSLSSMLQRVGRGNRRGDAVNVVAVAQSEEETALLIHMFDVASEGMVTEESYSPDLSVCVQQILSYLFQNQSGVHIDKVSWLLSPLVDSEKAKLTLKHLQNEGWIKLSRGLYYPETRLMDLGEKGRIHSNIPDTSAHKVVDVQTGKEVGRISGVFDDTFLLSKRAWKIISVKDGVVRAERFKGSASTARFLPSAKRGAFHYLLPPELRKLKT